MHNFPALLTPEVPVIINLEFMTLLIVLLPGHLQARKYLLHVSLVTTTQAYLKLIMKVVLVLWTVALEHCALKSTFRAIPHFPTVSLLFILNLHAYKLVGVYAIPGEFPLAEGTLYTLLLEFILSLVTVH